MQESQRKTIRVGPVLSELLETGACAAPSIPRRLELLAGRFQQLLVNTRPPSWPIETWMAFLRFAQQADLSHPAAIFAIQAHAKSLNESRLGFALDNLQPAQQIQLLVLSERYQAKYGSPDQERVLQFLADLGYSTITTAKA